MTHAAPPSSDRGPRTSETGAAAVIPGLLQTRARLDRATATLHIKMTPPGPARAGLDLLDDVLRVGMAVRALNEGVEHTPAQPVRFVVLEGPSDSVFGLGGDLNLLADAAEARDVTALRRFAHAASDVCHQLSDGFGAATITLAHVCGNALGGAFEAARSCDLVIAEENAVFALPEAEFDFVPGAGTMTAILPRIGAKAVREMVLHGGKIDAQRAFELDLVDHVAAPGDGATTIRAVIAKLAPRHLNAVATYRGIAGSLGLSRERFRDEAERWVATALALPPGSIARMRRLAKIQDASHRRRSGEAATCH